MIYTSYFKRANDLTNVVKVSISLKDPTWAKVDYRLPIFAPTWTILKRYKLYGNEQQYVKDYYDLLMEREPNVTKELDRLERYATNKTVLLLCWENPNKFCHRHLLADYANRGWTEYLEQPPLFD